jgi:hypothetical protein
VDSSCEYGGKPAASIKDGENSDQQATTSFKKIQLYTKIYRQRGRETDKQTNKVKINTFLEERIHPLVL